MFGINLYALLGVGALLLGLLGFGGYEYQRAEAQSAKLDTAHLETKAAESLNTQYRQDLAEAAADADHAAQRARDLDKQIQARDARINALEIQKKEVWDAFDKLAGQAPKAAQDCLASDLPAALLEWLRNDDSGAGGDKDGQGTSSGSAH